MNDRGGERWAALHKKSACQSTTKRDKYYPGLEEAEGVAQKGLRQSKKADWWLEAEGEQGCWMALSRIKGARENPGQWKRLDIKGWALRGLRPLKVAWESSGTDQDTVWTDRRAVRLGCGSTLLFGKAGWMSPDMGLKLGKANSLEQQPKTNKKNWN